MVEKIVYQPHICLTLVSVVNASRPFRRVDNPLEADAQTFDEIIVHARVPVLVDFWAAWCGPCRMAAPEVAKVAVDMTGKAVVLKIDAKRYHELATRFNVRGIPNFAVFHNRKLVEQQAGLVNHEQMEKWLAQVAS